MADDRPRLLLFLNDADVTECVDLERALDSRLPERYRGWPVRFGCDDIEAPPCHGHDGAGLVD